MKHVIALELNEIDFDLLRRYVADGSLPTFEALLARHDVVETVAEAEYSHLEPWIQWVTVHTGLTFAQHKVFRLGDISTNESPQIWEILEQRHNLRVGAISPMNACNRLRKALFFVPDPWTRTHTTGTWDLRSLTAAIVQAVNDNAQGKITLGSYLRLAAGAVANMRRENWRAYRALVAESRSHKWKKAVLLDLLLSDTFIRHCKATSPDYASLFLNAGAHVQHHYMFSSRHYNGPLRNPDWYVPKGADPVGDVYRAYDRILANILRAFPHARLLVCTGLSQTPNDRVIYYYRPRRHAELLRLLGITDFTDVQPRMSRDFLVLFSAEDAAASAAQTLESYRAPDNTPVFSVENRGTSLFCMLSYTAPMDKRFAVSGSGRTIERFADHVSHVSIENAIHRSVGYFIDTGVAKGEALQSSRIPLTDVFRRTLSIWEPA